MPKISIPRWEGAPDILWRGRVLHGSVGAWEERAHTHTRAGPPPRQPRMRLEDEETAGLARVRLLWMLVIELTSLSHNIISLHLWGVDLSWMADYSLPALLSPPHEACSTFTGILGCLTHLTPVIIAFRLVTGRINIHSGWDLFSGEVAGKCAHRIDGTCLGQRKKKGRYTFVHTTSDVGKQSPWAETGFFFCSHASVDGSSLGKSCPAEKALHSHFWQEKWTFKK